MFNYQRRRMITLQDELEGLLSLELRIVIKRALEKVHRPWSGVSLGPTQPEQFGVQETRPKLDERRGIWFLPSFDLHIHTADI